MYLLIIRFLSREIFFSPSDFLNRDIFQHLSTLGYEKVLSISPAQY